MTTHSSQLALAFRHFEAAIHNNVLTVLQNDRYLIPQGIGEIGTRIAKLHTFVVKQLPLRS